MAVIKSKCSTDLDDEIAWALIKSKPKDYDDSKTQQATITIPIEKTCEKGKSQNEAEIGDVDSDDMSVDQ